MVLFEESQSEGTCHVVPDVRNIVPPPPGPAAGRMASVTAAQELNVLVVILLHAPGFSAPDPLHALDAMPAWDDLVFPFASISA
jgi:hypothetical protein